MRSSRWIAVLALSILMAAQGDVRGQTPPRHEGLDCGPISLGVADSLVLLTVANVSVLSEPPAELHLQLLDVEGSTMAEQRLTLDPGSSRVLPLRVRKPRLLQLVRGAVRVTTGPEGLRLSGVLQVFHPGLGLTNGPTVRCAGDTGSRGPV
jgi:hypothetical protein